MSARAPHFLLFSETAPAPEAGPAIGRWRFVLRSAAGQKLLEAADEEDETPERLELWAIVRGLESLDQPSRVTLVTASRNIQHGLRSGLPHWRESGWHWERFGKLAPVKNADLWRRIDRALAIHQLECRCSRAKAADDLNPPMPPVPAAFERRLRFDGAHAAGMTNAAGMSNAQAPSTKQIPRDEIQMTEAEARFGHSVLGHWCLFEIWCLVIGAFARLGALARLRSLISFHSTT